MGAFWGNKAWCPGGLKSKKTLSKHDAELFNIVSRINATDQYYSLYHPTGARITAGQDLRNFLWDGIHSRLSNDHWFNVMPQSFRALANLSAQTSAWSSTFDNYMLPGLITDDGTVIKPDEYLFLWKQKKKVYYKPEVIQEMSEIINNSLSGSKVKYVVFSKQNWVRLVDSHGLSREYDVDVKLYQKEKDALEAGGLEFIQDINLELRYNSKFRNLKTEDIIYRADGWLFKIKEGITARDAEVVFKRIREKRLRELGIDC